MSTDGPLNFSELFSELSKNLVHHLELLRVNESRVRDGSGWIGMDRDAAVEVSISSCQVLELGRDRDHRRLSGAFSER